MLPWVDPHDFVAIFQHRVTQGRLLLFNDYLCRALSEVDFFPLTSFPDFVPHRLNL